MGGTCYSAKGAGLLAGRHVALACGPLRRRREPRYPTRLAIHRDRTLLQRHMPAGWLRWRNLAALAGGLLAAGCSDESAGTSSGLVRFMGDVALPPPHLREDEARVIIRDELRAVGIVLDREDQLLPGVTIYGWTCAVQFEWVSGSRCGRAVRADLPLIVDLLGPSAGVGAVYISSNDTWPLTGEHAGTGEDAWWQEEAPEIEVVRRAAAVVSDALRAHPAGVRVGVFYDRVPPTRFHGPDYDADRAKAQRQLRQQVRDFIDYLKAQGVL